MDIKDMRIRKKELGLTLEEISQKSGVPISTVQKVFAGVTSNPRADTMALLERVLVKERADQYYHSDLDAGNMEVREANLLGMYNAVSGTVDSLKLKGIEVQPEGYDPGRTNYTIEDYYKYSAEQKVELIDGRIYDMASPSALHQMILGLIYTELMKFAEIHNYECMPYSSPVDVRLDRDDKTMVVPDIFVVCDDEMTAKSRYVDGAPDLVIEILSPSTAGKDATTKLAKYLKAGVREYWMVAPEERMILVFDFEHGRIFNRYTFDDSVPVGISGDELSIDFARIGRIINMKIGIQK